MSEPALTSGAAFDLQNLESLKLAAKRSPQRGVKAVAQQLEGLFVQMMLKSMRDASFKGGLFDNQQSAMFTSMYDQQISQDMASGSKLGFVDLIARQVGRSASPTASGQQHESLISTLVAAAANLHLKPVARDDARCNNEAREENGLPENDAFVARLMAPAREVARKSGIPHQLIIAQAALESGWGNREILTREGKPSHNLFGIKATPDWKGEITSIATTEYINGAVKKVKAAFRVYKSYADAMSDYATMLTSNPRYHQVVNSPSAEKAAHALQAGGYATDPNYAKKLIGIVRYVENNVAKGVRSYKKELDALF